MRRTRSLAAEPATTEPAEEPPAEPAAKQARRRWTLRPILHALRLPALVAFIASVTALAYDLFPDLRPDPQAQLRGALRIVAVETDVEYGDYRRRIKAPTNKFLPAQLKVTGNLYYVEAETQGLKRERSWLRWYYHDAETGRRLADQPDLLAVWKTRQGTPADRLVYPVWASIPTDKGRYRLRFELSAKGVLLAIHDSRPFGYCREARCGARSSGSREGIDSSPSRRSPRSRASAPPRPAPA